MNSFYLNYVSLSSSFDDSLAYYHHHCWNGIVKGIYYLAEIMDHSPINQNFDLNKSRQNSIIARKSITKLVIFQNFVAKCCKMRII